MWPINKCSSENSYCKINFKIDPKDAENFQSCDLYVSEQDLLFCCSNSVQRFSCCDKFDTKDLKNLKINFDSNLNEFSLQLPCYPSDSQDYNDENDIQKIVQKEEKNKAYSITECCPEDMFDVTKLRQITDSCILYKNGEMQQFKQTFHFGFGLSYNTVIPEIEASLSRICQIPNPLKLSAIARTIQREQDERRDFCPDQYKLNFVELQIADGLENPMKFSFNYQDCVLTRNEDAILKIIKSKQLIIDDIRKSEIECGLVSILLAICYDVRTTSNEITCESAWTRTMLSSTLSYFESIDNLKAVVRIFFRRTLTYGLYRSYDLTRLCIEDGISALLSGTKWLLKQLLTNYDIFIVSDESRLLLNKYYIADYIQYVSTIDDKDLAMLAKNLKNALLGVTKRHIMFDLLEIETELLKELIQDIHIESSPELMDNFLIDNTIPLNPNETESDP